MLVSEILLLQNYLVRAFSHVLISEILHSPKKDAGGGPELPIEMALRNIQQATCTEICMNLAKICTNQIARVLAKFTSFECQK